MDTASVKEVVVRSMEALRLAEENTRKSELQNVEFLRGDIEHIPARRSS